MRAVSRVLVGFFMVMCSAEAQWIPQYAESGTDGSALAQLMGASRHPMAALVDAHIAANLAANDVDFQLLTASLPSEISLETIEAARQSLENMQRFSDMMLAGAPGERLVDLMDSPSKNPDKGIVVWGLNKYKTESLETGQALGQLLGAQHVRLSRALGQVWFEGRLVKPVATQTVPLKGALALFLKAVAPDIFDHVMQQTQRFFWTTQPLPEAIVAAARQSKYPFMRRVGGMVQIGFPTAGCALGADLARNGGIADGTRFVTFPGWADKAPLSTMMIQSVVQFLTTPTGAAFSWPVFDEDPVEQARYVQLSEDFAAMVEQVIMVPANSNSADPQNIPVTIARDGHVQRETMGLQDIALRLRPGDLIVRRWDTGGTAGVNRLIFEDLAGRIQMVIAEAGRSDPKATVHERWAAEGQGYAVRPFTDWFAPMGDKPLALYILRLKKEQAFPNNEEMGKR